MGARLSPQDRVYDRGSVNEVGSKYNNKKGTYQYSQFTFSQHNLQTRVETQRFRLTPLWGSRNVWNGFCGDGVFPGACWPAAGPLPLTSKLTGARPRAPLALSCEGAWRSPMALTAVVSGLLTDVWVPPNPLSHNQILPGLPVPPSDRGLVPLLSSSWGPFSRTRALQTGVRATSCKHHGDLLPTLVSSSPITSV